MSKRTLSLALLACALLACGALKTFNTRAAAGPTRLLRTPTVSATQLAFAYANNI